MDSNEWSPPQHVLGYTIRSRTRIYISFIIPATLWLFVYIVQTIADLVVGYQHFKDGQPSFGAGTLSLVFIPPILTYIFVLTSKDQRNNPQSSRLRFVAKHTLQLLLFPFFVIYRFMVRIFWSVESLFHDDDDAERMWCLSKAMECSNCELYLLIQAYAQAAPQIILQLYHMLTQDLFRDFETSSMQGLCLVFSAIDLAAITTSYHRFESQRKVGRHYPWSTPQQIEAQRRILEKDNELRAEVARKKRDSERTIASFPESDKIMANFRSRNTDSGTTDASKSNPTSADSDTRTHELHLRSDIDEVDNDAIEEKANEIKVLMHKPIEHEVSDNATDDDKIKVNPKRRQQPVNDDFLNADRIDVLDSIPDMPAPQPPPAVQLHTITTVGSPIDPAIPTLRREISTNSETRRSKRYTRPLSQLETFKDMLLVNAQLYIKEHVPRPPKLLITRVNDEDGCHNENTPLVSTPHTPPPTQDPDSPKTPLTPKDVVDFFLPRPTKIVNGIQQDDFAGRTVSFFGWIAFIIMRMLALTTFCVFYPKAFFILVSVHYVVMLAALYLESSFRGKLNRSLFYILLAYIYIFVLLEFRIKFKRIRIWYALYLLVTMTENITMTAIWYANEEFESWWYGFIYQWIVYSGILLMATICVYYCILRPKEVTLIVEQEPAMKTKQNVDSTEPTNS